MPRVPFRSKILEPKPDKPQMRGNVAREAPIPNEDKLGGATGAVNGQRGIRPGSQPSGTQPTDIVLPNVMQPTIELDDFDYRTGRRRNTNSPSEMALNRDSQPGQPIPFHQPDDAGVMRRLFGIDIEDI